RRKEIRWAGPSPNSPIHNLIGANLAATLPNETGLAGRSRSISIGLSQDRHRIASARNFSESSNHKMNLPRHQRSRRSFAGTFERDHEQTIAAMDKGGHDIPNQ